MEELLKFIESEIDKLGKIKLYTINEYGEEIECYDGECIFHDGCISGKYEAYTELRDKILDIEHNSILTKQARICGK